MASVLRCGGLRLANVAEQTLLNAKKYLPAHLSVCFISGKMKQGADRLVRPPPYDYKNKTYNCFYGIFDRTSYRMNENSKVILVEGPAAAGKTKFAKELAEELDMLYFPHTDLDEYFINPYGYDMRQLDPQLPEGAKSFDLKNFLRNPNHRLAAQFQMRMYMLRYSKYIDALAHLFSTGQGVVLDRSVYSDYVFAEAMKNAKFLSKNVYEYYELVQDHTLPELIPPHLVIYLDVPVDVVKKRVKERNLDYEVNSKAMSDEYLQDIEKIYKQKFLKNISVTSELLVYDWSDGGDTEVVVEDIERIDFDSYEKNDKMMKEWRFFKEEDWIEARIKFANNKPDLMNLFNIPGTNVPELHRSGGDSKIWRDLWFNAPGNKYIPGYNEDMGDTGILFKTKTGIYGQ